MEPGCRPRRLSVAFQLPSLDDALAEVAELLQGVPFRATVVRTIESADEVAVQVSLEAAPLGVRHAWGTAHLTKGVSLCTASNAAQADALLLFCRSLKSGGRQAAPAPQPFAAATPAAQESASRASHAYAWTQPPPQPPPTLSATRALSRDTHGLRADVIRGATPPPSGSAEKGAAVPLSSFASAISRAILREAEDIFFPHHSAAPAAASAAEAEAASLVAGGALESGLDTLWPVHEASTTWDSARPSLTSSDQWGRRFSAGLGPGALAGFQTAQGLAPRPRIISDSNFSFLSATSLPSAEGNPFAPQFLPAFTLSPQPPPAASDRANTDGGSQRRVVHSQLGTNAQRQQSAAEGQGGGEADVETAAAETAAEEAASVAKAAEEAKMAARSAAAFEAAAAAEKAAAAAISAAQSEAQAAPKPRKFDVLVVDDEQRGPLFPGPFLAIAHGLGVSVGASAASLELGQGCSCVHNGPLH